MKVQWRRQSLFPSTQKPGVFPFSSSVDDVGDGSFCLGLFLMQVVFGLPGVKN